MCAAKHVLDVEVKRKFLYPLLVIQEKQLVPLVKSTRKESKEAEDGQKKSGSKDGYDDSEESGAQDGEESGAKFQVNKQSYLIQLVV